MATWPRGILPRSSTPLVAPSALVSVAASGKTQLRGIGNAGWQWTETYQPLDQINAVVARNFIAFANYVWGQGIFFDIVHYAHLVSQGGGTGSPLVAGGSQTGPTLNTDTWGGSNPVLRSGDIIKIAGLDPVFMLRLDAPNLSAGATTLTIIPPILTAPANNAAITYDAALIRARLVSFSFPMSLTSGHIIGASATFQEAP